jgi:hypothetical protein
VSAVSHTYGDERIVEWLGENGYHPRSPKHGSASCLFLLDDFLHESELFREAAANGEIVYQEDYTVGSGQSRWNTDLVVGPPTEVQEPQSSVGDREILEGEPEEIWLAIDAKSVMTEHGKARRNRQRDINSFADIMHQHYPGAVTGGVLLINMAERFRSPLREEGDITEHDRIEGLVKETVDIFRDIDRSEGDINHNVDGAGCIVIEHTNMDDGKRTRLVSEPPAPQPGDIAHYRNFVEIIAEILGDRFLRGEKPDIEDASNAELLRHQLNQDAVEVARLASEIGRDLGDLTVESTSLDGLRDKLEAMRETADEIEVEFTD